MTLAEKLKETEDLLNAANITNVADRRATNLDDLRNKKDILVSRLFSIKNEITSMIEQEKVPFVKVSDYVEKEWFMDAIRGNASFQFLWDGLANYFLTEGLELRVKEQHDGGGMESWVEITAVIDDAELRAINPSFTTPQTR